MHVEKRKRRITGTGGKDKTVVMGVLQRGARYALPSFRTARKGQFKEK